MRTRSQSLAAKRKVQDAWQDFKETDEESSLTKQETLTASKRPKRTKAVSGDAHTETAPIEKRLRGYRARPTPAIRNRIQRALDQRLYLLAASLTADEATHREYRVFGQTGNVYTVTIAHLLSCTCPDHTNGYLCKHIIFVLHRVLKVDRSSPLLYQKALLTVELQEIFAKADIQQSGSLNDSNILAERKVREAYHASTGDLDTILDADTSATMTTISSSAAAAAGVKQKPITADDDCPICCESMEGETNDAHHILFCSTSCGNSMHAACFNKWRRAKALTGEPTTCPFCRIEWETIANDESVPSSTVYTATGYLNLAAHSTTVTDNVYNSWYFNYRPYRWRRRH